MKRKFLALLASAPVALFSIAGCSDDAADDAGLDAKAGSCTVEERGNGQVVIRCPDSEVIVNDGRTGAPGRDGAKGKDGLDGGNGKDGKDGKDVQSPCVLTDNPDGTHSLTCGGNSVVIGAPCENGFAFPLVVTDPENLVSGYMTLFQVTNCTWLRGDLLVSDYHGEQLPPAVARVEKVDGSVIVARPEGDGSYGLVSDNEGLLRVALPALKTVGGDVGVAYNPTLVETSFPELTKVGGELVFKENEALASVGAFPKLQEIGWSLGWESNPMLTETPDFPALESLAEAPNFGNSWTTKALYWENNASLEKTGNFPALVTVAGHMGWEGNVQLVSTGDFPLLETIFGTLYFDGNEVLETIGSFESLANLGALLIASNLKLATAPELPAVTGLEGNLYVTNNAELTSLEGLASLTGIGSHFIVTNNAKLPICEVMSLVDAIRAEDGIGGTIDYTGNDETDTSCFE